MEYIELGICLVPMKWRFVRFSTLVAAQLNIIAKEQAGKTNLKHGAYLHQPMAYSLASTSHMRTPGQWEWRSKSTKFQIHSTSQILL